jgi:hypothetical protein
MRANSSFKVENAGVIAGPLERARMLSETEERVIEAHYAPLHERATEYALRLSERQLQNGV